VADVAKCVTMDLKSPGNLLYLVGETKNELGGSHFALVNDLNGGQVPTVDPQRAKQTFAAMHAAIDASFVRACHDLSEGGLAAALAEMAFAGGLGVIADLGLEADAPVALFSESNTRFICEVAPENADAFAELFAELPLTKIGSVTDSGKLSIACASVTVVDADIRTLKETWQAPLRW
jgi:phosphoribosylformylglycinamidine synthase subunit PurSL